MEERIYPIFANKRQINQVILNLCKNAIDAMSDMRGVLTVELSNEIVEESSIKPHPSLNPGKYAKLVVGDNGIGMGEKTLERVFEPYYTTKPMGKGTGIGLAVVHGIIKKHNGFIDVHSRLDRGTTFTLFLPAYDATPPAQGHSEQKILA